MNQFKSSTTCINIEHPSIQSLAHELTKNLTTNIEKAIVLYYKVRDGWKYNPYNIHFTVDHLKVGRTICGGKVAVLFALIFSKILFKPKDECRLDWR